MFQIYGPAASVILFPCSFGQPFAWTFCMTQQTVFKDLPGISTKPILFHLCLFVSAMPEENNCTMQGFISDRSSPHSHWPCLRHGCKMVIFFVSLCSVFITSGPKPAKLILFKPDCKVLRWFWFLLKTCIWKWWRTDYSLWRFWPPSFASEYHQPSSCSKVSVHIVAFTKIWIFCVRSMWCWCAYWHW